MNESIGAQEEILWQQVLDEYVRGVHFAFFGLRVVATTSGGRVYLYSNDGIEKMAEWQLHSGAIISSSVAYNAPLLATGGEDGSFLLTQLETGKTLYEHTEKGKWVEHVAFSPDSKWVAFACGKEVRIINAKGELYGIIEQPKNTISALSWHNDSNILAIGFFGGVCLYNLVQKKVYQYLPWQNAVISLTVSRNKKWVCGGTQDCQVHI